MSWKRYMGKVKNALPAVWAPPKRARSVSLGGSAPVGGSAPLGGSDLKIYVLLYAKLQAPPQRLLSASSARLQRAFGASLQTQRVFSAL